MAPLLIAALIAVPACATGAALGWYLNSMRAHSDKLERALNNVKALCSVCGQRRQGVHLAMNPNDGTDPRAWHLCEPCTERVCREWLIVGKDRMAGMLDHVEALGRRRK